MREYISAHLRKLVNELLESDVSKSYGEEYNLFFMVLLITVVIEKGYEDKIVPGMIKLSENLLDELGMKYKGFN